MPRSISHMGWAPHRLILMYWNSRDSFRSKRFRKKHNTRKRIQLLLAAFTFLWDTLIEFVARVRIVLLFHYYFSLCFAVTSSMIQKISFMKSTFCFSLMHSISFSESIYLPVAEAMKLRVFISFSVFFFEFSVQVWHRYCLIKLNRHQWPVSVCAKKEKIIQKSKWTKCGLIFFSIFPFWYSTSHSISDLKKCHGAINSAQIDHFSVSNSRVSFFFLLHSKQITRDRNTIDGCIWYKCKYLRKRLIVANEFKTANLIESCVFHWRLTRVTIHIFRYKCTKILRARSLLSPKFN